jgi:hemoglobin/transferrin/lactoferrin receptor protein
MKYIAFIAGILFFFSSQAQIITVLNGENNRPLELVTLWSENPYRSAITNAKGQADISEFEGADEIKIRLLGFEEKNTSYAELERQNWVVNLFANNISLNQVVVSATRWDEFQKDVPVKVSGISPRDISLQSPQTTADVLGTSGEVFIQKSQQGGGSPMIRGFATNRLLIAVDGVRMNNAIFRSGNLQNVISIDPFTLERTEVLFGPGSVIYGSDAIGGVMSFQTITPQLSLDDQPLVTGKAISRYSSANSEFTGHLDVQLGWKNWAIASSFSQFNYGDLRMGAHGPEEYLRPEYVVRIDSTDQVISNSDPLLQRGTGYSQTNLMQKIRFRPSSDWNFEYGFHYSETSNYDRYDRLIRYRNGTPRSAEWYYGPQVWMMNNFNINYNANNSLFDQMDVRLAHQQFEESRNDRDFGGDILNRRFEEVTALSANLDFRKFIGERHELYYGVEAVWNDVSSRGSFKNISNGNIGEAPSRYPNSTWGSYAAYLNYQFQASEKISYRAGIRYNQYILNANFDTAFYNFPFQSAEINNGALSGSFGIMYHPGDKWSVSANLSTGFRAPNIDDIGKVFDSEPGSVVVPNPNLSAEYAYNAEVGVAHILGNSIKLDATAFYTILDNALVRRDFTLNGNDSIFYDGELSNVQAIQNAAQARVYGLQLGVEVKIARGLELSSRYNIQKGEEELVDGSTSPLRHAAPWFGITRMNYRIQNLTLEGNIQYNGEMSLEDLPFGEADKDFIYAVDENGNPYSPGWYTLNFKAMYQLSETWMISGGLENLTNQRYRPYSSGLVAPGRNFILSLRAQF